ncbi:MAG: hypothetical protein AAFY65_19160 [Pseudomonadota bacterium]
MIRAALFALPFVAACVPVGDGGSVGPSAAVTEPGQVRIVSAVATPGRLTVRLSDGARCIGERPEGVQTGWSGVTGDCAYQLPYTVTFKQGGHPQRFTIEDPTGVPGAAEGAPGPRAETFITDVNGQRRLFISSLGPNVRFGSAGS